MTGRWVVGALGVLLATSPGSVAAAPNVDVVAVLLGDGRYGYGRSLDVSLDALVDNGVVGSAGEAPPTDGAARADVLRLLAAGSATAVIVQGDGYGSALTEVAMALPDEAFIWIPGDAPTVPSTRPAGLPNVATVYADVEPAATLLGELLDDGRLADVESLGWNGSSEPIGDDGVFITALIGAAALDSSSVVLTSRLSEAPADDAFDAVLVSGRESAALRAPLRIEIAGSVGDGGSDDEGGADARRIVVGFHFEVALAEILATYGSGGLGATEHYLTLENGGLTLEATDPDDGAVVLDALVDAGLVDPDPSPTTTLAITEPDAAEPAENAPEPSPTSPSVVPTSTSPRPTTPTSPGTAPPVTGGPGTTQPTSPATTEQPGTTTDPPTLPTLLPPLPTLLPPPATDP